MFDVNALETYLKDLRDIRSTGAAVAEMSYYPVLSNLFNELGKTLKPKVRCVINIANRGAGLPDGGLFTADQFQKATAADPKKGQLPARGAVEVKGPGEDVHEVARSKKVKTYCAEYGLVLVTNYRDFLLLGRDAQGNPLPIEGFTLADSEGALWSAAAHPHKAAKEHGERFSEYLKRVMLSNAPLSDPEDVAWFLASYARDAKARVEAVVDLPALASVREALEEALGMKFTGPRGEHFFRSSLVQTIFYGVFSAWVLWHRERPGRTDAFDWRTAAWSLRVPFIRTLYDEIATPSKLGPLGLVEVLDWTAAALNRVNREAFFQKFQDEHAVQYFYEPFLEAFDPELRKELGVWFTPPEIVQYQVARVDTVLREELGLADGLADPNVIVLDPCCGTAAYLLEVLKRIAQTLKAKGGDALMASDLKKAAMTRIFGFEILPAPFVVAHLQLGLLFQRLGAPLSAKGDERVGVYLTNALTGWEPPKHPKKLLFPELEEERDAAEKIKREAKILVVIGNPPYNAFAGVSPDEEQGLVEPYKGVYFTEKRRRKGQLPQQVRHYRLSDPESKGGWGIKKFNLDDLYVRFFRLAERRIAEMSGKGVVSFISNQSWVAEPSFVVLRKHLLGSFDRFWIENLHGNRKITEYAPDGGTSETVFAIRGFSVGIQQGVATSLWIKTGKARKAARVLFRDDLDAAKADARRGQLLATLAEKEPDANYVEAEPSPQNRYSFRPENVSAEYTTWPKLPELSCSHYNGPVERRAGALISIERRPLESRMQSYFNAKLSNEAIRSIYASLMMTGNRIVGPQARKKILSEHHFEDSAIVKYPFKVFDLRWSYLANLRPLFSEPSPDLLSHRMKGNSFFITRDSADKIPEGPPFYFSPLVCDYDCISGHARHFPILLAQTAKAKGKTAKGQTSFLTPPPTANLSPAARAYLAGLGVKGPDASAHVARLIWMHALAVGYSPAYLAENADGIRRDWPRIPLPDRRKALEASAALGREAAALLDTEGDVPGVTAGAVEGLFRTVGVLTKVGGGELDPDAGELAVTAGWGHAGKEGVTMPGKGRIVERPFDKDELEALSAAAKARGLTVKQALALLGPDTRDMYLSGGAYWKNVPAGVWEFYIGGYQVIKKWLSYREQELLGRALRAEEAREVTAIARRLAAIILLQPALDDNYRRIKAATYPWPAPGVVGLGAAGGVPGTQEEFRRRNAQ